MNRSFRGWLSICVILAVVAGVFGAGCQSSKDKEEQKRQKRLERQARRDRARNPEDETRGPDQVIGRRDSGSSDRSDRSPRGLQDVPTTATRVDEGAGPRLTYSPTRDGTIYVYDSDGDRVILSTRLRQDERFVLDPDANRATVDGRTVLGTGLNPRNRYRLYFDRGTR